MGIKRLAALVLFSGLVNACASKTPRDEDPRAYLEEVRGERAIDWVKAENARTLDVLHADPRYKTIKDEIGRILLATDRIPYPALRNGYFYNFWQDDKNVRGLWRRVRVEDYSKKDPPWQVLIDVDELARRENENWVWHGSECLPPAFERCLLTLSRGGRDASVIREFDLRTMSFVKDGFELAEAKSRADWVDENTILFGSDFGPGSLTSSGYPRIVKRWHRGSPIASAETVFEGEVGDVSVGGYTSFRPEGTHVFIARSPSFWEQESWLLGNDGKMRKVPLPRDAILQGVFEGCVLAQMRRAWKPAKVEFAQGSLVALPIDSLDASKTELLVAPDDHTAIHGTLAAKDALYVQTLHDVKGRILRLRHTARGWKTETLPLPANGMAALVAGSDFDERIVVSYEDFLSPTGLSMSQGGAKTRPLKSLPARFDATGLATEQHFVASKDGTKIPYFVVYAKGLKKNAQNPTLLYGYGGFENAMTPGYLAATGKVWSEAGGVYVLANIRGGGEYGPRWHLAALKENRQKAFDDFIAVAEDLIRQKITSPAHLGIMGGSNGGLLMGAVFTQRPELFKAVVCQVPLLDMLRYHKLLAGASWMAEYGDPDNPVERPFIEAYSPYQKLSKDKTYPEVFFVTSTEDDRVHPGHARKMAAKMKEFGKPFWYYENIEGGHGAAANLQQRIERSALEYTYLWRQLK